SEEQVVGNQAIEHMRVSAELRCPKLRLRRHDLGVWFPPENSLHAAHLGRPASIAAALSAGRCATYSRMARSSALRSSRMRVANSGIAAIDVASRLFADGRTSMGAMSTSTVDMVRNVSAKAA